MIHPVAEWDNLNSRWNAFQTCVKSEMAFPDDGLPSMCLALFAREFGLSVPKVVLIAWLYGMCYNPLTVMYIYSEIEKGINITTEWWSQNKSILEFEPDKAKIKNMNKFIPAFESYLQNKEGLKNCILTEDFEHLVVFCKRLKFVGFHAIYLMCDVLQAYFGNSLPCLPQKIDWKTRKLPTEGALMLVGADEMLPYEENKPIPQEYLDLMNKVIEYTISNTGADIAEIESVLCAFRKLYKQTRYTGYYRDRHLEDINKSLMPKWITERSLKYRKELLPIELLGEYSGWSGIRKEKCKEFMKHGKL